MLVLDHAKKPAEKVRISGGGRCNFTNLHTAPERFISANPHFAKSALARYTPGDFLDLLERHAAPAPIIIASYVWRVGKAFGFNAQTEEYGDLVAMGVIDPAKVVRSALQNAASVAGLLITTEAGIAEAPKKDDAAPAMPDMGGMGGMGGMGF